jgi:hypothetical protein
MERLQCEVRRPSGKAFSARTKGFGDWRKSGGAIALKGKGLEERRSEGDKFRAFRSPLA